MKKKFRKVLALMLASSMMIQSGSIMISAEETVQETAEEQIDGTQEAGAEEKKEKKKESTEKQTEAATEKPTEAPTEKPTEAATEKPTEAPTEKATEAPAEKPTEAATEKPTEAPTEKPTEAATEKPTEAPTEKPTEAATEKPTEAPTEKPTEAATEKPTEAATEKPTEAPTEKPTEAATEKPTEAPTEKPAETATEKTTETPTEKSTETDTEAPTEKETELSTEKQTSSEKDTEKAVHVNDGKKIKTSVLREYMKEASSWLVAAGDYSGEEIPDEELLTGEEASALLKSLKETSLILANGRSTSEVEVINLYADQKGRLDTTPLKEKYDGEKIDVTSRYAVVNVVASSADQDLSFSGYDLVYRDAPVTYESITRAGYVLYNFTAMEDGKFTDYEGTVTLSDGDGLQGTYLAPSGEIKIQSDLYGAVYADQVESQTGLKLTRIVLIDGRDPAAETEISETTVGQTEVLASETAVDQMGSGDTEPAAWMYAGTAETTAGQADPGTAETQAPAGTGTAETQAPAETGTAETQAPAGTGTAETQAPAETGTAETQAPAETGTTETQAPAETGTSETTSDQTETPSAEDIVEETDTEDENQDTAWYSEKGTSLNIQMVADKDLTPLSSGTILVKAAKDILKDGAVVFEKNQVVVSSTWAADDTSVHKIGSSITCEGKYYIEVSDVPEGYLAGVRLRFAVDNQGKVVFGSDVEEWNAGQNLLRYVLYAEDGENTVTSTKITLTDGTKALSGAEFLVKDSKGEILMDDSGRPEYYISVVKGKALLEGLAAGSYYLSQIKAPEGYLASEDVEFTVKEGETGQVAVVNQPVPENSNTLSVTMETIFQDTQLTAEKNSTSYMALFLDEELTRRVTDVRTLTQKKDKASSEEVIFAGLETDKKYYLSETDEYGIPLGNLEGSKTKLPYLVSFVETSDGESQSVSAVKFDKNNTGEGQTKSLTMRRTYKSYPEKLFSYRAKMKLSLRMHDAKKNAKAVTDTFYITLYRDAEHTVKLAKPVEISLKNQSSLALSLSFKMTVGSAVYYALETDKNGNALENGNDNYDFAVSFLDTVTKEEDGSVKVECGQTAGLTVTNTLSKSVVKMKVTDQEGSLLSGAELVIKNSLGKVLSVNKVVKFHSEKKEIVWTGILPEGKYYLSEVKAPDGYLPAPDVEFTVESGREAEAVLVNQKAAAGGTIVAGIQFYAGQDLLYAQDTTNGQYASEGRYTRYAALFSDEARTQKVTDVKPLTVSGFTGLVKFEYLKNGTAYYMAETDQYGQVLTTSRFGGVISYTNGGKVSSGSADGQIVVKETFDSLPAGFRYTARLTLEKRVVDSSGNPRAVIGSFYIGIFRSADYSDTPTVIRLDLNNTSSASVTKRVLLSGENNVTYYIAEVDQSGKRISESSDFAYTVSIDNPQLTLTKSADVKATVTNKDKISKVSLYLTKRVYDGDSPKRVTETFYAGLFKDPEFTQLYTDPIPMKLENSSTVTLKLSLNLGKASEATIYVAEVDKDGKIVTSGESFGYDVKMINAAAAFNQERTEIQTILLNSVYGTSTDDDWNSIISDNENEIGWDGSGSGSGSGSGYGYYGNISDNGGYSGTWGTSGGYTESVQTGDTTPWALYLMMLFASGLLFLTAVVKRRRKE